MQGRRTGTLYRAVQALTTLVMGGLVTVALPSIATAAPTPPLWTYARYMSSNVGSHYQILGESMADAVNAGTRPKDALALLDFGHPRDCPRVG